MPRPELVIFDCDGVLVDSERISHEVLQTLLAEHGVILTLDETFGHFMGRSSEGCRDRVAELLGAAMPDDFMRRFGRRTFDAFAGSLTSVPGVTEVLDALASPFCVASNGPHEKMRFTLGHTGLLGRFEGRLFSAQDVARPKPAPDLFLHAAQTLGAAPGRCVVVEDSPTGVAAARAAGMAVYGYAAMGQAATLQAAGATRVFDEMPQLLSLL